MIINKDFLDQLSAQAKSNPRLRQNYDMRTSSADQSQRMLNALEVGTVLPIHRHTKSTETMVMVRGALKEYFYDNEGNVTDIILLEAGGETTMLQIPVGQWHSLEVLQESTIIFEAKDGAYEPLAEEDIINFNNRL